MLQRALSALKPRRVVAVPDEVRIEGERVYLRPLGPQDVTGLFACASDPEVTRFLPWEPAKSVTTVRGFVQDQTDRRRRGESMAFAVVLSESHDMIGSTDLMDLHSEPGRAELGYLLRRASWGQGLMTEAATLTLGFAFETLGLHRVIAFADAENLGSRRVLEKSGFRPWGSETRTVKSQKRLYIRYEVCRPEGDPAAAGTAIPVNTIP